MSKEQEISCPYCEWTGKGESNLKRHTSVKHKKTDGIMIVSVPADNFTYNQDLGIYEGNIVSFPPGYEIVSVMNKLSLRQAVVNDRTITNECVTMVIRRQK